MARRVAHAEANRSGMSAARGGMHSTTAARASWTVPTHAWRMPPHFTRRDVENLLDVLWGMFTQREAEELVVTVPWDDADKPQRVRLAEFATLLESWLA